MWNCGSLCVVGTWSWGGWGCCRWRMWRPVTVACTGAGQAMTHVNDSVMMLGWLSSPAPPLSVCSLAASLDTHTNTLNLRQNRQFTLDSSPLDISPYPARLGLELGVGIVGLVLGLALRLWFGLVGNILEGNCPGVKCPTLEPELAGCPIMSLLILSTSPPAGGQSIAISVYVCLLVRLFVCLSSCPLACLKTQVRISRNFRVYVICGCGSVLLWRQCSTLCTSGFVDDVMFSYPGLHGVNALANQLPLPAIVSAAGRGIAA